MGSRWSNLNYNEYPPEISAQKNAKKKLEVEIQELEIIRAKEAEEQERRRRDLEFHRSMYAGTSSSGGW